LSNSSGEPRKRCSVDAEERRPVRAGGAEDLHAAGDRAKVRREGLGVESRVDFLRCLRLLDASGALVLEALNGATCGPDAVGISV
jgi:hypothetical protein